MKQYHGHILNLLPREDLRAINSMKLSRFFLAVFIISACVFAIGIVLMLPTAFFLYFQKEGIDKQTSAANRAIDSERVRNIESESIRVNQELALLEDGGFLAPPSLINMTEAIAATAASGIEFTKLSYSEESSKIIITGRANTRELLLVFETRLRSLPFVTAVSSPVENILKEENIVFSMELSVSPHPTL